MNRREFLKQAMLAGAVAVIPKSLLRGEVKPSASPNFVFILVDDMGWTGLSTSMHETRKDCRSDFYQTPRIAKLAEQGMRFSNAYAPSPMCTPSRASFITGKSPAQLHMTTPGPSQHRRTDRKVIPPQHITEFPEKEVTIAELLKKKNYASAYLGKWHLSGGGPGKHGFDVHDGETGNGGAGENDDPNPKDFFGISKRANAFMETHVKASKPFYLQLSHYGLHKPIKTLAKTKEAFGKLPAGKNHSNVEYAAMTKDFDTSVGQVLDKIDALGIAENTYVIFMSDNGAGGGPRNKTENAPLNGGKASLWEGGIRVPMIVRGPGVKAGSFCNTSVIGADLFPTLGELAGETTMPKGVEGTSLAPLLAGKSDNFKREHQELVFHFPHYGRGPKQTPMSAIRSGDMKLLKWWETGETKLFDLSADLGEKKDLTSEKPDVSKALLATLEANLKRIGAQQPTINSSYDPSKQPQRSAKRRRARARRWRP
jgi:arylsulfatase A-like enzyme